MTLAGVLFLWLPLLVVVLFSLHETASLSFPFDGFSLRWYERVFESAEVRAAVRSSLVVATTTALVDARAGHARRLRHVARALALARAAGAAVLPPDHAARACSSASRC